MYISVDFEFYRDTENNGTHSVVYTYKSVAGYNIPIYVPSYDKNYNAELKAAQQLANWIAKQ